MFTELIPDEKQNLICHVMGEISKLLCELQCECSQCFNVFLPLGLLGIRETSAMSCQHKLLVTKVEALSIENNGYIKIECLS